MAMPAFAQDTAGSGPTGEIRDAYASYAIRPQSLAAALRAYSETSGLAVMVDSGLAAGRRSPGVQGRLTASAALQRLLGGTGLAARYVSGAAFTLVPVAAADAVPSGAEPAREDGAEVDPGYAARTQQALLRALCRSERTRPGSYRLALQLWIAPAGTVERLRLLDGTGDAARDRAIGAQLEGLALAAPPPDLLAPLTVLLLPRPADCAAAH